MFLNIGSNCGDRRAFIDRAVELLRLELPGVYAVPNGAVDLRAFPGARIC